ncbi:MAG: ketopantoate reductase family protein [Gammaproteobacteria bacterium]
MKFTIIGAGALGTILAAHLVEDGHDVACVVRNNRAEQLRNDGLKLIGLKELNNTCQLITSPELAADTDVLIVATKTYQTEAAIAAIRHIKAGCVFSIANGVKKNEQLATIFGQDSILGCMANVSGELLESGTVNYTRNVCLHLGALNENQSAQAQEIASAIDKSGIVCRSHDNITTVEWSKYVGWVAFMSLAVITRSRTIDYLRNDNHARLAVRLIKEMAAIANAKQVELIDQSPMPVKTIADGDEKIALNAVKNMGEEFATTAPEHRMSSLQDLERGARLEHEDTLGYAMELAQGLNLPAPTIRDCYDLVAGIDAINRAAQ